MHEASLVLVTGPVGSGKTRLAEELAARSAFSDLKATYIQCEPGDLSSSVCTRAERALEIMPGSLGSVIQHEPRLLLLDDLHNLPPHDATRLAAMIASSPGVGRVVAFTRDVLPLRRGDQNRRDLKLEGLDETACRELWAHLEEVYGPTQAGSVDDAIARTRGYPLALRREYARAAAGRDAWDLAELDEAECAALEAAAVLRVPASPAAIAALTQSDDPEEAIGRLVALQLLNPIDDGRFGIHDIVREEVLDMLDAERRRELEARAAALIFERGRGGNSRISWDLRDGAGLALLDPVDRMREGVRHLVAAGDIAGAVARLVSDEQVVTRRGSGGELFALLDGVGPLDEEQKVALTRVRADASARHGRVAEALDLFDRLPASEDSGDPRDRVSASRLAHWAGDIDRSEQSLRQLMDHSEADVRGRAAAAMAEILVDRGEYDAARELIMGSFDRDRAKMSDHARVRLGLVLASTEEALGDTTAARSALSRAASSASAYPDLAAELNAALAGCLVSEGRLADAEASLQEAEAAAREVDEVAVAEEIRRRRAVVNVRRGELKTACEQLRHLVESRRQRGDEIRALRAEIDYAWALERRGEVAQAAELAAACAASAARRGLHGLAAHARVIGAAVDTLELRLDEARKNLDGIIEDVRASSGVRRTARALRAIAHAWAEGTVPPEQGSFADDEIESARIRSSVLLAAGDVVGALESARSAAVWAERAGRAADVADALSLASRMYLARGDKNASNAAATRAVREARACGFTRAQARGLIVLAALRRDQGDRKAALEYARDAALMAGKAGLSFERLIATEAIDVIDEQVGDTGRDARDAAAATMSEYAIRWSQQTLSDLGLTAARPFRVVDANGADSYVADANPGLLRMEDRSLTIDGVREVIVRDGNQIADLRRRSLLKRLLFLFAASPTRTYSKEDIVQSVWEVDYHPLRHDAALFTNIMRIRRLLGKDGADLIRVSEDGYRFVPPSDFLFVENVAD